MSRPAGLAERNTQWPQKPSSERACGFESHTRHSAGELPQGTAECALPRTSPLGHCQRHSLRSTSSARNGVSGRSCTRTSGVSGVRKAYLGDKDQETSEEEYASGLDTAKRHLCRKMSPAWLPSISTSDRRRDLGRPEANCAATRRQNRRKDGVSARRAAQQGWTLLGPLTSPSLSFSRRIRVTD
jgi:hypothetical protein